MRRKQGRREGGSWASVRLLISASVVLCMWARLPGCHETRRQSLCPPDTKVCWESQALQGGTGSQGRESGSLWVSGTRMQTAIHPTLRLTAAVTSARTGGRWFWVELGLWFVRVPIWLAKLSAWMRQTLEISVSSFSDCCLSSAVRREKMEPRGLLLVFLTAFSHFVAVLRWEPAPRWLLWLRPLRAHPKGKRWKPSLLLSSLWTQNGVGHHRGHVWS